MRSSLLNDTEFFIPDLMSSSGFGNAVDEARPPVEADPLERRDALLRLAMFLLQRRGNAEMRQRRFHRHFRFRKGPVDHGEVLLPVTTFASSELALETPGHGRLLLVENDLKRH